MHATMFKLVIKLKIFYLKNQFSSVYAFLITYTFTIKI